jgi:hypothetical protein
MGQSPGYVDTLIEPGVYGLRLNFTPRSRQFAELRLWAGSADVVKQAPFASAVALMASNAAVSRVRLVKLPLKLIWPPSTEWLITFE